MASPKTLNAKNLEALGAARLAALLIEVTTGSAAAKRRLRLELAGEAGVDAVRSQIAKRLTTIATARSIVTWGRVKTVAADIEAQHRAIIEQVAPADPKEALALLWRLIDVANAVLPRSEDFNGKLLRAFETAAADLGRLAEAAKAEPAELAERAFEALVQDGHDILGTMIPNLAPALGAEGLARFHALVMAWRPEPVEDGASGASEKARFTPEGAERRQRERAARVMLQQIADAQGDVDTYAALFDAPARSIPAVAAEIALRQLETGRATEALQTLDAAPPGGRVAETTRGWHEVRIAVLEALGRGEEAQAARWARFEATLAPAELRAYLDKLPDFEDFDAEQSAIAFALACPDPRRALEFLVAWPALDKADRLVRERPRVWNGDHYELLTPAAEALESKYPLAATILRRAMIDFTLVGARSKRYRHAARHLAECAHAAPRIESLGDLPSHDEYLGTLLARHGRKIGFWQEVSRELPTPEP
ncbi:DUF6880 family protein [Sphingosinicella sp. BN140058]|uniref:DUF6880 family protein n=1 Tax=Sphingosinicella sp. BN140058 TaxID=1892855 RepID=UPI0010128AA1|nr:DUF6880 family protein [Sphingosinicella sp. BN140058]QAY79196.1 hypothetical protein ETR14_23645 [Sphingosinicella sp. BN140058]